MIAEGNILKMKSEKREVVHYFLPVGNNNIPLNDILGRHIQIEYQGQINCIKCGRQTKTSFGGGYCYPCFQTAPEAEECVLRPELCRAHEGIARDMEYAVSHCLIPHYVYLAYTGGFKVGVTRSTQIPTRWIDQGAVMAVKIAKTENRYQAGLIEVALKKIMSDKTNWRAMLTDKQANKEEMKKYMEYAKDTIPSDLKNTIVPYSEIVLISYPVLSYPSKAENIQLDKTNQISGELTGIKGQYLLFAEGRVINIRNHSGYYILLKM